VSCSWVKTIPLPKMHLPRLANLGLTVAGFIEAKGRSRVSELELNLDFETNLHDLGWRYAKIRCGKVGVEVHRGEQRFPPDRHT
jgi:hypothetical protein